ncbi:MAG: hypothetical protein DMF69_17380 [Acidobacteria bacterium]|nr:MAG: hypothetical protein DMF69_17380 [Acidobacteriota bacterium]
MAPATLKIKTRMLERGDSIAGLAREWNFTRALLTKVIHGERCGGDLAIAAQKRVARYMNTSVRALFPAPQSARKAA